MSLKTKTETAARNDMVKARVMQARAQASRVAAQAGAQAGPLATSAKESAKTGVLTARAWAAPKLASSGQALESRVAPKVSAMMSSAAQRIDPGGRKRRRWPLMLAGLAALAAAAAAIFSRRASAAPWRKGEPQEDTATPETDPEASTNANGSGQPKVRAS